MIGKGGETIKSMQANTGARIQVCETTTDKQAYVLYSGGEVLVKSVCNCFAGYSFAFAPWRSNA